MLQVSPVTNVLQLHSPVVKSHSAPSTAPALSQSHDAQLQMMKRAREEVKDLECENLNDAHHCKNVTVISTLPRFAQLHLFRG